MSNQFTQIIIGENNLTAQHPWIEKWLKNKEDGEKYSAGSNQKIIIKCPYCETEREVTISNLIRCKGSIQCRTCGDGISYPNKFGRAFLKQLPIQNLKFEYKDTWTNSAIYDDYFEYQNQKYLVEFDGSQHLDSYTSRTNPLYKQIHSDEEKNILAKQNGYILIRIDSQYSELEWMKKQIENSLFNQLFDLSKIDWIKCGISASNSKLIETCKYFNEHPNLTPSKIGEVIGVSTSTASDYLFKGTKLGLCNYTLEIAERNRAEQVKNTNRNNSSTLIYAYDEQDNLIGTYLSQTHAADELNKLYPDKHFGANAIGKVTRGEFHRHKGFHFERRKKEECH